jgi:transposase-like protein
VHIWRQIRSATKLTRMLSIDDLFKGCHFDQEIIILCVPWYLRFILNFRDLVEEWIGRELESLRAMWL